MKEQKKLIDIKSKKKLISVTEKTYFVFDVIEFKSGKYYKLKYE